jgi:hypothetical protein
LKVGLEMQEHVIKLCMPPEMYLAVIKYMAKHEIGKPYAGLSLLCKALRSEGFISQENFEKFNARYSRKLVIEEQPKETLQSIKQKQHLTELSRTFSLVLEQWNLTHKPGWREHWIMQAKKHSDLKTAQMILDLAKGAV